MGRTRSGGWIAGTVILVLAIFAGTWFMLAAPRLEEATATMLEAQDTQARNDLLVLQNAKLKADFDKLDDYRAELADLQTQIPTTAELAAYTRLVDAVALAHGLFVLEVSPGLPQAVVVPTPPVVAAASVEETEAAGAVDGGETDDATDTATDTAEEPPPAAPTGPTQIEGFVAVPVQVKVVGAYPNVLAFLADLQTGQDRLLLVTGLDGTQQDAQEPASGKPAVAEGDLELVVRGFTYVLRDMLPPGTSATGADESAPDSVKAPLPVGERNPFAPLGS